ncbi:MAG: carbon-nitrogen hydrolase family protein [Lachnospiraceae bacterium]|nr:carbon-nitrogen hydrolase family protein [Lachnospiraceae bacterium]
MKIAMAQMSMSADMDENEQKILSFCDQAADADLLFFPEVQYSPFFAQYKERNADRYLMRADDARIVRLQEKAREHHLMISPNIYMKTENGNYDTNLWIDADGSIRGMSKMVHVLDAENFWEKGYYTPSDEGFRVYDTPFGKVGIVICFDRHMPESIRTCALKGADLVIIPTANLKSEPMEMFKWEVAVQAMQNQVYVAMCNRVGAEGEIEFAGESLLCHPSGEVLTIADDREQLVTAEIDLSEAQVWKDTKRPFLPLRRPEVYY